MRLTKRIVSIVLSLTVLCLVGSAPALALPIVSVQPASVTIAPGQPFSLNINIANVTDLFAFQFDLDFKPLLTSATSITEGPFLPGSGATFFVPGTIDNVVGTIAATANTLIGAVSGMNGSGTLATATFTALTPGTESIGLSNVLLLASSLAPIEAAEVSGSVTIQGAVSAVPEPATWLLVGMCAIVFAVRCRGYATKLWP